MRALLFDDRAEHVGILAVERMAEVSPPDGVDAQERRDEQHRDVARESGLAQRRHGAGDAIEQLEDRRERVLDRAEPALDGRLLGQCGFALWGMLDADRLVGLLGRFGNVGCALVGDELQALAAGGGLGDDAHDHLVLLTLGDRERVEQMVLAIAEVLDADQLEVDV